MKIKSDPSFLCLSDRSSLLSSFCGGDVARTFRRRVIITFGNFFYSTWLPEAKSKSKACFVLFLFISSCCILLFCIFIATLFVSSYPFPLLFMQHAACSMRAEPLHQHLCDVIDPHPSSFLLSFYTLYIYYRHIKQTKPTRKCHHLQLRHVDDDDFILSSPSSSFSCPFLL